MSTSSTSTSTSNKRTLDDVEQRIRDSVYLPFEKRTRYVRIVESFPKYELITAPCQAKKSDSIGSMVGESLARFNDGETGLVTIISCDDNIAQLDQLERRIITQVGVGIKIVNVKDTKRVKCMEQVLRTWTSKSEMLVFFCLDNASQIGRLALDLSNVHGAVAIDEILLIHDEADVITKESTVDRVIPDVEINNKIRKAAKSHNKWIEIINWMTTKELNLHRVFVSATPDNVVRKYPIQTIYNLPIPEGYTGWNNVHRFVRNNLDFPGVLHQILTFEINRIHQANGGVLLYCLERVTKRSIRFDRGHSEQFHLLIEAINRGLIPPCVLSVYNGNGITVKMNREDSNDGIATLIDSYNENKTCASDKATVSPGANGVLLIKNLPIAHFYEMCKRLGERTIVTIGKDMMSRGISFVSSEYSEDCLAAVSMIYSGAPNNVSGAQQIGRILGTARPDIPRHLYCTSDVISNYENYNKNFEEMMTFLETNLRTGITTRQLMSDYKFRHQLTRSLDRPKVKCNEKFTLSNPELEEPNSNESRPGYIDGVKLLSLRRWMNEDTIVARIIRYLLQVTPPNDTISFEQLKRDVNYEGSDNSFRSNLNNGCGTQCAFGKIWIIERNTVRMNPNIRNFLASLN
jgi:hypothetical protein